MAKTVALQKGLNTTMYIPCKWAQCVNCKNRIPRPLNPKGFGLIGGAGHEPKLLYKTKGPLTESCKVRVCWYLSVEVVERG